MITASIDGAGNFLYINGLEVITVTFFLNVIVYLNTWFATRKRVAFSQSVGHIGCPFFFF